MIMMMISYDDIDASNDDCNDDIDTSNDDSNDDVMAMRMVMRMRRIIAI